MIEWSMIFSVRSVASCYLGARNSEQERTEITEIRKRQSRNLNQRLSVFIGGYNFFS